MWPGYSARFVQRHDWRQWAVANLPGHKTCRFPEGARRGVRACARDVRAESVRSAAPSSLRVQVGEARVTPNRRRGKRDQQYQLPNCLTPHRLGVEPSSRFTPDNR
jgi:hypothetical protein